MATKGKIPGTLTQGTDHFRAYLYWRVTNTISDQIENNRSLIRVEPLIDTTNSGYTWEGSVKNLSVTIGSKTKSNYGTFTSSSLDGWTYSADTSPTGRIAENIMSNLSTPYYEEYVYHNDDGTMSSLNLKCSYSLPSGGYGPGNVNVNGNVSLDTIPRESSVVCSSPYIGDSAVITINKRSTNFTNTVTYNIGGITGTIATKTFDTVLQLDTSSLKSQIYALIPSSKSITGTIYCTTYNGNTQIGTTQSTTFNLYAVENDCKPTVSGVVIDTNQDTIDLTGDSSIIVKNASKPKVTITATPNYSSTITSYLINLNDGQTSNLQENTFDTINSNSITTSATDSREYSSSYTIDLTNRVIDYVKLHFNTVGLQRPEGTSNEVILNANGVWFNGNFSQSNSNTLTCTFQYKKSSDNSWTNGGTITPTISNNIFTFSNFSLGSVYDYDSEYQFKIIATDLLMTVGDTNADAQTVPKGVPVVEIGDELVNVNGSLTKNNVEVPVAKNTKTNSQVDTYSCNFMLDYCHPVGEVFMTTDSSFDPNTSWGGTWQQITDDAYLKIVSSNAGSLGGTSSQHKIPIESLPSHSHELTGKKIMVPMGSSNYYSIAASSSSYDASDNSTTKNRGGGQAYYPYYYGVYAWHRTA